jgi:hypothetical protein
MVVRSCAVSIALALAASIVCGQTQPTKTVAAEESDSIRGQNTRIVSLLEQLADQARASENLAFAVRAQSQAARLLWAQEPDRAREIYQRAFQLLAGGSSKSRDTSEGGEASRTQHGTVVSFEEKRQLRTELLNQIAARDPELAEKLARSLADLSNNSKGGGGCADNSSPECISLGGGRTQAQPGIVASKAREGAERRELLMGAALQIVDHDAQQALTFAQMSVALGISSNLARLLTLMRTVDAERADLLFSNAVARLEQAPQVDLADVRTLGSYVVSVVNSGAKPLSKPLVIRFLNFAFVQLSQNTNAVQNNLRQDDSAELYFLGRQLTDLFGRYLPFRLHQLQRYVSDQSDAGYYDEVIDPGALKVSAPADIARDAIEATEPAERDSLYARAALAWLGQSEMKDAQTTAMKISDAATRDRVLVQIVRRHAYEKRIDDALGLTRRISDDTAKIELLALLSSAARASKDNMRAAELLDEAAACSLRAPPTLERARSLVMIASSFSSFDMVRSFEVLQSAVRAVNDLVKQEESKADTLASGARPKNAPAFTVDELYASSFDSTLATLAKSDFDGALALARQLPGEEASLIAQLAVCGGGLAERTSREQPTTSDDIVSGLNH